MYKIYKKLSSSSTIPWVLVMCFFSYTVLSWILLFRDKRALEGIGNFYPQLESLLFSTREILLQNNLNTVPTLVFGLVSVVAIYMYLKSLTTNISLKKTILFACIFQIVTFISYPILSTDIFSYMFSERVATVHNENVWKVMPAKFPNDPFFALADWKETTSVYGGVHFASYLLPSLVGQNNLILLLSLYKFVPILFAIPAGYVLYLLLKLYKPEYLEKGLRVVFWSPLFVLEIFGSGHNDIIMIFFVLLSVLFYKKKKWLFMGIALALAVQVKVIPLILLFFFAVTLLRKRSFHALSMYMSGFILVNIVLFSLMQVNLIEFLQRVLYNNGVYWQSLINVLRFYFDGANIIILLFFFVWIIFFTLKNWKKQKDPVYAYAVVLLVYLLFVSSAYWNWYILWILPLIPFIKDKKVFWTTIVFSFTSLLAYPLLWTSLRFGFGSPVWPFITYLFIFGIPIVAYILHDRLTMQEVFAEKA